MKLSGVIEALIAVGGSVEQIAAVVRAAEAEDDARQAERRAKATVKKRRQRALSLDVPGTDRDTEGQIGTDGDPSAPAAPSSSSPPHPPNNYSPTTPASQAALHRALPRDRASLDDLERRLREAASLTNSPNPQLFDLSPINGLLDAGYDLEQEILPVIRSKPGGKARSWGYYVGAIRDSRAARSAAASQVTILSPTSRGPPSPERPTRGVASAIAGIQAYFDRETSNDPDDH